MAKDSPIKIVSCENFSAGLNTIDEPHTLQPGESPAILNMDVVSNGAMMCRYGYELVANDVGLNGGFRGILPFYKSNDTNTTIDQSLDEAGAYTNIYTPPVTISEAATARQTFTPTKTKIQRIGVRLATVGTGDYTLTLHDALNVALATKKLTHAQVASGWIYFDIPYTWTAGTLHFHVTSTVADGTIYTNTMADMEDCSFKEIYSLVGDRLVLFHNDGNVYYTTYGSAVYTSAGTYGSDNGRVMRGCVTQNFLVFAQANPKNTIKKWDGATISAVGSNPPTSDIFATFQKRLFVSGNPDARSTYNYSATDDIDTGLETNWQMVNNGDGEDLTAIVANTDSLNIFKENSIYQVNIVYDTTGGNYTVPLLQPVVSTQGGCVATGTTQPIYGYTYYLSRKGFESWGPNVAKISANISLPLSLKIQPTVEDINYLYKDNFNSTFFDQKYMCLVAMNNSTTNDTVFVFNENAKRRFGYDSWTMYDGINALQFCIFRNSSKKDELYFISQNEPKLYKFNKSFSDNGFGYDRYWTSKTFHFGERTTYKYLDIEGAITLDTKLYLDIWTDGQSAQSILIDKDNLITAALTGDYIGFGDIGQNYVGGGFQGSSIPMYNFRKRIYFPDNVNDGYEMYFRLRNSGNNEGWALKKYRLAYVEMPDEPAMSRSEN